MAKSIRKLLTSAFEDFKRRVENLEELRYVFGKFATVTLCE